MRVIPEHHNHRVKIKLKENIWDIAGRIEDIQTIRDWIAELTEWQEDEYTMNIYSSGGIMDVWFKKEEYATLCALRWS
jgi:hypothetical protein